MSKEIKFVCEDCGEKPEIDKKQSNKNWNVYQNKPCKHCGGKITIKTLEK
jgi:DNA-directed RNA polymerase subunit RPC12/RpoP